MPFSCICYHAAFTRWFTSWMTANKTQRGIFDVAIIIITFPTDPATFSNCRPVTGRAF
jgi:hypothetical protein